MVQSNHNPTALSSMMSIYIISRIYPASKDTVWVNYHPTDTFCTFLAVDVGICEAEEELDRQTDILTLVSNRTTSQNYSCYYSVFMACHRSVQSSFPSVPLNLYLSSSFLSRSLRGAWCPAWQQIYFHSHTGNIWLNLKQKVKSKRNSHRGFALFALVYLPQLTLEFGSNMSFQNFKTVNWEDIWGFLDYCLAQ